LQMMATLAPLPVSDGCTHMQHTANDTALCQILHNRTFAHTSTLHTDHRQMMATLAPLPISDGCMQHTAKGTVTCCELLLNQTCAHTSTL
jgi:hypothetical protein